MALDRYKEKRDFKATPEPSGKAKKPGKKLIFVVQKHDASHLHYDFRLEMGGVLKSWAVPKGPSLDPRVKRLAMEVEDHPYDYKDFEGEIPKGNYGAGEVIVWDAGVYLPVPPSADPDTQARSQWHKGHLSIVLLGKKLKGEFGLVRTDRGEEKRHQWLLIKAEDQFASKEDVAQKTGSVLSRRKLSRDKKP
jgi:bifunctional non-homologous end joining protein LigD